MKYVYPVTIEQDEAGFHLITFPDVPEAGTDAPNKLEALSMAEDALIAALGGYINAGREIPLPSESTTDQVVVRLPPVTAAKVALYCSLRAKGLSTQDLAIRLGVNEKTVARWLDLDQRSSIEQIMAALEALGQRVVVSVEPA